MPTIRSFTGYLLTDLGITGNAGVGDTFDLSAVTSLNVVIEDDDDAIVGDIENEVSGDANQLLYVDQDGVSLFSGTTFFIESEVTFTIGGASFTAYQLEDEASSTNFFVFPPGVPAGLATVTGVNFAPTPNEVLYADIGSEDEIIDGSNGLDISGADTIFAGDGDDTIYAGASADSVEAGDGDDSVFGGDGADTIFGGADSDTIRGDDGADELFGGAGADAIAGGVGDDTLTGADGADALLGGVGADELFGGAGADTLAGGDDADLIEGDGGADLISGGAGADTIEGGADADTIDGGAGDDSIEAGTESDSVEGGAGDDTIIGGDGADTIRGDDGAGAETLTRQSFNWSELGVATGGDLSSGGAQDTGLIDFTFSYTDLGRGDDFTFIGTVDENIDDLDGGGETVNNNSAAFVGGVSGGAPGDTASIEFSFAASDASAEDEVRNVQFRINDIDDLTWRDQLEVFAYDANGIQIPVTLTVAGVTDIVLTDEDGVDGAETASATDGEVVNTDPDNPENSLLVEVAGPVSRIVINYSNLETGGQRVDITDVFFDAVQVETNTIVGDDSIDGGDGGDQLFGGGGEDTIIGGAGVDNIDGGDGADSLDGGGDLDFISGGEGDDTLIGGAGGDFLFGGDDDDSLQGGEGADFLTGGEGSDTLDLSGADVASGGAGPDVFIVNDEANVTFTITDFDPTSNVDNTVDFDAAADQTDNDFADLSGFFTNLDELRDANVAADGAPVQLDLGDGQFLFFQTVTDVNLLNFENVNVVCFTRGTLLKTPSGERRVEELAVGDIVTTKDHGARPIRWIGSRQLSAATLALTPRLRPVVLKAGAFGAVRDLAVSPQHRVMVSGPKADLMFGEPEVLAKAKDLVNGDDVYVSAAGDVEYFHILFDDHEIVFANGAPTESFHPGAEALGALEEDTRAEVLQLFPELADEDAAPRPLARLTLRSFEARALAS